MEFATWSKLPIVDESQCARPPWMLRLSHRRADRTLEPLRCWLLDAGCWTLDAGRWRALAASQPPCAADVMAAAAATGSQVTAGPLLSTAPRRRDAAFGTLAFLFLFAWLGAGASSRRRASASLPVCLRSHRLRSDERGHSVFGDLQPGEPRANTTCAVQVWGNVMAHHLQQQPSALLSNRHVKWNYSPQLTALIGPSVSYAAKRNVAEQCRPDKCTPAKRSLGQPER